MFENKYFVPQGPVYKEEKPREYEKVSRTRDEFMAIAHRGFGERTISSHDNQGMDSYPNTLTGLEVGVKSGANVLEVDLARTKDGHYVLYHLSPLKKELDMTLSEFQNKYPESPTLDELADWLSAQDSRLQLFVEMKSTAALQQLVESFGQAGPEEKSVLEQIMVYGSNDLMVKFLEEKKKLGLGTDAVKLWYLTNKILTPKIIDQVTGLSDTHGSKDCRFYGVEQGMMPLGIDKLKKHMSRILNVFAGPGKKFSDTVNYAKEKGFKMITGTVDDVANINWLMKEGINGVVPNNPVDLELAGLERPPYDSTIEVAQQDSGKPYVPASMKQRVSRQN